jgi:hypothetical protein
MSGSPTRRALHLTRRFFGTLRPGGPGAQDAAWVAEVLEPDELALWSQLPHYDRRHAVGVARRVEQLLAGTEHAGERVWVEAALLHDVGKLDSGFGPLRRVGATLAGAAGGRDMADLWSQKRGVTRRVGLYLRHPELGATRIRLAGGSDEAARWAAAHHDDDPHAASGLPRVVVDALCAADDD